MKKNLFLRLCLMTIALLSLHSCRNEYQETANQHQHSKAEQFVSFQKFLEITHIQKDGFYQNLTAKTFALNDFDIDTEKIRQTLRNNTATAFSFVITPTDDTQKAGNTFYNLAYIKQSDNSWNKYVIKYVSNDADFVSHLGNNPELKFQGTNEVLYFENNVSKNSLGLCAFTSEVEVWNCPAGHTKLADCYESGGSSSCCMPCISINSVTTVRECSTGTGSGGPDVPYNPDGGSGGGDGDGSVFEPNLPLNDPKANTPCGKVKTTTTDLKFKAKKDTLAAKTHESHEYGYMYDLLYAGTGGEYRVQGLYPKGIFIKLDAFPTSKTFMHSHIDIMYPIFSPGDVIIFNEWIKTLKDYRAANPNTSIPLPADTDLSYTVVTSQGSYMLTFDGAANFNTFPTFSDEQVTNFDNDYALNYINNAVTGTDANGNNIYNMAKVEEEFLKFINVNLKMNGLKVFRINDTERTELRFENNARKEYPCP